MKPFDPRLLRFSKSSRGFVSLETFLAICNAALLIMQSYSIASLVTAIFQRRELLPDQRTNVIFVATIFLLRGFLNVAADYLASQSSAKMRSELRAALLDRALDGKSQAVFNQGPASLSLLATRGIDSLDQYFARFLPQLFIAVAVPLAVGISISLQDATSGALVLVTVPLIPIFGILIGRYTATATKKRWQTLSLLSGYFLDLLSGLPTLKVFQRSKHQRERLEEVGERYREETMKVLKISFLSSLALELVATLSVALIAVSIGLRLIHGSLSLHTGLFVLILAPEVYWPIRQVSLFFHAAADGVEAANKIFAILEESVVNGDHHLSSVDYIEWSNLTISYPAREVIHIPAGRLEKGRINLLVGPSGSGKSSLLSILLHFSSSYEGEVIVGSEGSRFSLRDLESSHWRSLVSWLPQEVKFSGATLRQTISGQELDDALVMETLMRVGLKIDELPSGLDTQLGSLQEPLSVGQRRKIALARALLKPAPVLLVDEPSASVDDLSESEIASTLQGEVDAGRLVVVVTHRINLIGTSPTLTFGAVS